MSRTKDFLKRLRKWTRKRRQELNGWRERSTLLKGRVSRLHKYEAKERYHTLKSVIENKVRELDIMLPDVDDFDSTEEVCCQVIRAQCSKKQNADERDQCVTTVSCWKTLLDIKGYITRRSDHLNNLWRAMTRIRISLMEHNVLTGEALQHLNFCKEEAFRLGVRDDREIEEMIARLAEELDLQGSVTPKFKCQYRALLERLNTIRTGRIHQQYRNITAYKIALGLLVLLSPFLFLNSELFLAPFGEGAGSFANILQGILQDKGWLIVIDFMDFSRTLMKNILFFVFYGGFLGGLFSVTMRERPREPEPGQDAYVNWYILTKPFIGAIGAVFLYVLILGGLFSSELVKDAKDTQYFHSPGALTFGFAFIAGFSERLVFPSFR